MSRLYILFCFLAGPSKDSYGAGEGARAASQVVGQAQVGLLELALARFALKLLVDLVNHADAAGPDGVAEALQTAVGVDRKLAFQGERAGLHILPALASGAETQVFID